VSKIPYVLIHISRMALKEKSVIPNFLTPYQKSRQRKIQATAKSPSRLRSRQRVIQEAIGGLVCPWGLWGAIPTSRKSLSRPYSFQ